MRTDTCWSGGTWLWVHAEITDPPAWLCKDTTGVSINRSAFHKRDMGGWDLVSKALLNEISLLSPGVEPAFARARVTWIGKPESPAAGRPDRRPAAGEVIYGDGTLVRRHYGNAILAVGGRPVRTSAGQAIRRNGRDVIVDHEDGSSTIYSGADGYREALRDGVAA